MEARKWIEWAEYSIRRIEEWTRTLPSAEALKDLDKLRTECMSDREEEYSQLLKSYKVLEQHLSGTDHFTVPENCTETSLKEAWLRLSQLSKQRLNNLQKAIAEVRLALCSTSSRN